MSSFLPSTPSRPTIRVRIVRFEALTPEFVRERVATLSPAERAEFYRMADPGAADVRAVLRVEANALRKSGRRVSVAHAGRFGAIADSADAALLGVDLEPVTGEIPDPALVSDVTSPEEFATWSVLPEADRAAAFLRLWTLKEATLKARPKDFYSGLRAVPVSPDFRDTAEPGLRAAFVEADPRFVIAVVFSKGADVSIVTAAGPESF